MDLKMRFDSEQPSEKLIKNRKFSRFIFYMYLALECFFVAIAGYMTYAAVTAVMGISDSNLMNILLLFCSLNIMTMFMTYVIWFCCESSYYKMLENQNDLLVFLKRKLGE